MDYIRINNLDNVVVALCDLKKGKTVAVENLPELCLLDDIPLGHKFSIKPINAGDNIIKYGYVIGIAKEDIFPGCWVHTHNLKTSLDTKTEVEYIPSFSKTSPCTARSFNGYLRKDGRAGTRNEVWIVPTVGCVNSIGKALASEMNDYADSKIDGIKFFAHPYGCSQMGEDHKNTQKALAALVNHPNAGAVLVLGLGCENNNITEMKKHIGPYDEDRVKFLECQSQENEIEAALDILKELIDYAARFYRSSVPISKLVIGLKCGGSDGLSGITANPLVGAVCDKLITIGASCILAEIPEMFGAESIILNRCKDSETYNKVNALIESFKQYFIDHNQVVYENPSPGNKAGGISSLEDKSCGCVQKGGTSAINGVLEYCDQLVEQGLNVLRTPGNDIVSSTALALSGAQIILFTTGRGTPLGACVPTIKISSNSSLAQRKSSWIDFNAGSIVSDTSVDCLSKELLKNVLFVAEGELTKSEISNNFEFAIFKQGVTL